jgi:outer membrane protein TolC
MVFLLAGLPQAGITQDVKLHSVEEALQLALSMNVDYQNYTLNQKKADLDYKQAKSFLFPQVTGNINGQWNLNLPTTPIPGEIFGEPGQSVYVQFGQEYTYNTGIYISQEFFNREAALQSKMAKLSIELAEVEKQVFEEVLKEQVCLYYYTGLIAQKTIQLGQQDLESAEKVQRLSQQKYQEGVVDLFTFNTSKINANKVRQNLNSSKQLELQCLIELKKLFGMGISDQLILAGKSDYHMPEIYGVQHLQTRAQIKHAGLQLQQTDVQLKASKASQMPTLSFNSYFGRQQFRDDFGIGFGEDDWTTYSYLSLNLSVPIFTGLNNRSRINKDKMNQQIALNEKRQVEQHAALEDELLIAEYSLSLNDAEVAFETYLLYKENHEFTFQKYEEGLISLDSYHSFFEEYLRAESTYLNAMSKLYTYYSQILPRIQL